MLGKLDAPSFTQINLTNDHLQETEEVIISNSAKESNSTNLLIMNLHEPVIINDVEKAQDQSIDKLYDAISNDSKDNTVIESDRIIYSRDQLIRIYKLNKFGHLDQVINNPNFPKRVEMQSSEDYFIKLIEFDCSSFRCPTKRINKPENGNNIKHKKELGFNDDEERGIEQFEPNNLRLNRQFVQPQENLTKPEFSKSTFNNNGNYNNNLPSNGKLNKKIHVNNNFIKISNLWIVFFLAIIFNVVDGDMLIQNCVQSEIIKNISQTILISKEDINQNITQIRHFNYLIMLLGLFVIVVLSFPAICDNLTRFYEYLESLFRDPPPRV